MERSPDPDAMTPYQALIRDTRLAKRMTIADLARRAGMPRSTLHKIENQPPREPPANGTVDKLSSALGISKARILDAVSESLGLRVGYGRPSLSVQQMLDVVRLLPADQQARWTRLARALADALATEDEREVTAQSENSGDDAISTQNVAIDRSIGSHDEQIVAAGPEGALPPTAAEQEYLDTLSDAALERMRRRHTGE